MQTILPGRGTGAPIRAPGGGATPCPARSATAARSRSTPPEAKNAPVKSGVTSETSSTSFGSRALAGPAPSDTASADSSRTTNGRSRPGSPMRISFILGDFTAPAKTRKPGVIGPIESDVFPPFREHPGVFRGALWTMSGAARYTSDDYRLADLSSWPLPVATAEGVHRMARAARITALDCLDLRFPTSASLDGSDAMNPDPDYSAAYVILRTDAGD